VLLISHQ
ncbi:arginine N-succinyltransferase beta subunit, partial [Vibrio parahaemolyticus VPTS-2010]